VSISTKIGLHIESGFSGPLVSPTGVAPTVVKLVNPSSEYVGQVRRQVGPDTLIVVRWTEDIDLAESRASMEGLYWFNRHLDAMRLIAQEVGPGVAFEGPNEPSDDDAIGYRLFERERLWMMQTAGLRSVVGNWSVGRPSEQVFPAYRPIFEMMGPNDLVGFHGYAGAYKHISNPWHTCRFSLPEFARYLEGKQIVMTEIGADFVKDNNLPESEWGARGWKAAGLTEDEYLGWLRRFGEVYDGFPQVVGACVFAVAGFGWGDFDVTDLWPRVVAEYAQPAPEPPAERWETVSVCEFDAGDEHLRSTIERRVE
jgi:hypothetical protein